MTDDRQSVSHHPAPRADRLSTGMATFILFTGPVAWLVQLCVGAMLLSWPCFPDMARLAHPIAGYGWTRLAALLILLGCALLAAVSGFVAWRKLREVRDEREGDEGDLIHIGHGRTRFTALWGMILGWGFAVATLATLAGFALVPRCAG